MSDSVIHGTMFDPLRGVATRPTTGPAGRAEGGESREFRAYLLDSLAEVNRLQKEADVGVQRLVTGETDNYAEVFAASRKAGIAFDLLMEIRNKMMEAYQELQQMRV